MGVPSAGCKVCFRLYKEDHSLHIQIDDDNLLRWLHAIPSVRNGFEKDNNKFFYWPKYPTNLVSSPFSEDNNEFFYWPKYSTNLVSRPFSEHDIDRLADGLSSISMNLLLPCYPEVKEKFAQDRREGCSFDALELFVRHFLREGSVFATFGLKHLYEKGTLTELHFHDIQSQSRSISEDLDLLDEAIDKFEVQEIKGPSPTLMNTLSRTELRAAITQRDPMAVRQVLATGPGAVDITDLCLATYYYEQTVFLLLVEHGIQLYDADYHFLAPLVRRAEEAGHMGVAWALQSYCSPKGEGCLSDIATALAGDTSRGHLKTLISVMENDGLINGIRYKSPLCRELQWLDQYRNNFLPFRDYNAEVFARRKLSYWNDVNSAHTLFERGPDFHLTPHPTLLGRQLQLATRNGDLDAVKRFINDGADVNPMDGEPPLCLAARHGWFEIVRLLVRAGANVNPRKLRDRIDRSPLAEAALGRHAEVAHFLSFNGATLLQGEYQLHIYLKPKDQYQKDGTRKQPYMEHAEPCGRLVTIGKFLKEVKDSGWFEDKEDCPAVAAVRAQERRITARRLFAKVASSRERLLNAGASQDAPASLKDFVDQVGPSSSVFKSGTRAIRDISEGYMPSSLRDIVSALQVADAMRSAVPPSKLVCSEEEYVSQNSSC